MSEICAIICVRIEGIMKYFRLLLVLGLVFLFGLSSYSAEKELAPGFVRVTTNMMGYNFIAKKVAQSVLKKTLKKSVKGDYKVKFDSYSGVDLKKGKFKGLYIDGENLCVDDNLHVSKVSLKTTSDYNYVDYKKSPMEFKTDVPMEYSIEMTEADLNKTLSMGDTLTAIASVIPLVKVEKPKVQLQGEKIRLLSSLKLPFAKPIKFSMSAKLKVDNGKIVLDDVKSTGSNDFAEKLVEFINEKDVLNDINVDMFDDAETKASVKSVVIRDKKLYIDGNVTIKKSK